MTAKTRKSSTSPETSTSDLLKAMRQFSQLKVLVVGDLFLDEYIESEMYEISKEGPIPVVRLESKSQTTGAAGNLAVSIRNLGATVSVVGIVGQDANGRVLLSELRRKKIRTAGVVVDANKPTLTYTKVRSRVENTPSKEILRMDILPDEPLRPKMESQLLKSIREEARRVDCIVALDQIDHLISDRLLQELPKIARRNQVLLHGSSRERIRLFRDFDLLTPNDREAHGAVGGDPADVSRLGRELRKQTHAKKIMLTLGSQGMALFTERGGMTRMPTLAAEVEDVTGAGDAVSAVAALGNTLGWDLKSIAWTASHAAAIAIAEVGTHHVTQAELRQRLQSAGSNS